MSNTSKKFFAALVVPVLLLLLVTFLDIFFFVGLNNSLSLEQQIIHAREIWFLIWSFVIISGVGYFAIVKDVSETIGLIAVSATLFLFGLEDILVYIFQGLPLLSASLPWLDNHIIIGNISNWLHNNLPSTFTGIGVTGETLLATGLIGLIVIGFTIAIAVKAEWEN